MRRSHAFAGLLLAALTVLPACGGGSGAAAPSDFGSVQFAVTDAASDLIDQCEVDVLSVALHGVDGAVVEALPRSSRIDFADLVALSEILTVARVPVGAYDRVALLLDFSTAAVHLIGQGRNATVLDRDGNAFTRPTLVRLDFPTDRPFHVTREAVRFLELDFDLDASLEIDEAANTARVGPVLFVEAEPSAPKPVRAFGRLVGADEATATFVYEVLRPEQDARGPEHRVKTLGRTVFWIDGTTAEGAEGFALLAAKPQGTRLEILGFFDPETRHLVAVRVEAGRGVYEGALDVVEGVVLGRLGGAGEDARLVVSGTAVDRQRRPLPPHLFHVLVSFQDTHVAGGEDRELTTDHVSVGQRIAAFGDFRRDDAGFGVPVLDAMTPGQGLIRLLETEVAGTALGPVESDVLFVAVASIAGHPVRAFDFSGAPGVDPAALRVATLGLLLPRIDRGSAVVARGVFAPVTAPERGPDFLAFSVVDRTETASTLRVRWDPATDAPFSEAGARAARIDLSAAVAAGIDVGEVAPRSLLGGADPALVPVAEGGVYAILHGDQVVRIHGDFGAWLADLRERLDRTREPVAAVALEASGRWEADTRTLLARRVAVVLR